MQHKIIYWLAVGVTYVGLAILTKQSSQAMTKDKFNSPWGTWHSER